MEQYYSVTPHHDCIELVILGIRVIIFGTDHRAMELVRRIAEEDESWYD